MAALTCKCVFYKPEQNAKGRPLEIEFRRSWNAKRKYTNRQWERVNEKKGVICLVIMVNSRVMVIKMSKMAQFLYFLLMSKKTLVKVWTKHLRAPKRFWARSENDMVNRPWRYHLWDVEVTNIKETAESAQKIPKLYFQGLTSW